MPVIFDNPLVESVSKAVLSEEENRLKIVKPQGGTAIMLAGNVEWINYLKDQIEVTKNILKSYEKALLVSQLAYSLNSEIIDSEEESEEK